MAQTNYTPISLYYSTTASAVPVNTNLVNGELAININTADGKLYYKDSAGVVQLLASKAGASGSVTSVAQSFTGGIVSVGGSPITTSGTLALTVAGTSGGIPYFSSGTTWASSAALTQYGVVYGGGAGASPVATAAGTTGQVLTATTGGAPSWSTISSGGMTLLGALEPTAGSSSIAITGLSTAYKSIVAITSAVGLSSTAGVKIELSVNNGSSYTSSITFTNNNGSTPAGWIQFFSTNVANTGGIRSPYVYVNSQFYTSYYNDFLSGPVNAIRISTASTFLSGTIFVYGIS